MSNLLLTVFNMSFAASWLVLAVVLLRLVLKKAPRWIHVLLWAMVGLRLVCPLTLESALSLIPSAQVVSPQIVLDDSPAIHTGIPPVDQVINPVFTQTFTPDPTGSANPLQIWVAVAGIAWLAGMAAMGIYTAISYWRLRRRVMDAVLLEERIYQSGRIDSPFVLGFFRPRIYLPAALRAENMPYVIAHERAHICRKDHWWKPLGFLILAVHWFNPLMWLAYILLCRDIELACDEKVVRLLDAPSRADYSQALLSCSVSRASIAACPLAFGEVGVKARVKSILNYKKPGFWILLAAVIACVAVAVCFLTDPANDTQESSYKSSYSDRVLAIGVRNSDGSVLEEKATWYYFAVHSGDIVTVPGDVPLKVTIQSVKEKDFTVTFDTALYYEGQQTQELEMKAVSWKDLHTGTPGGSTQYSFLNMSRVTNFEGAFPWIPDTTGMREERTTMHPSFPGVTFYCSTSSVRSEGGPWGQWELFTGMPVRNVFFSDLSGDGLPEICATVCFGSGMIDTYVMVVDFAAGDLFMLRDRGIYDYFLEVEDNTLVCVKRPYNKDEELARSQLSLVNAAGGSGRKLVMTGSSSKNEPVVDGTEAPGTVSPEENLTLEAVLELAKKGEDLTWEDLEPYNGTDIGSGLYIMFYPIDDVYRLLVSGGGPDGPIMSANLGIRDTGLWVDIRTGDVAVFLKENGEEARNVKISDAIIQAHKKEYPDGLVNAAAFRILDTERVSGTPLFGKTEHTVEEIVYLYTMYGTYAASGGTPSMVTGQYAPAVAVFRIDASGGYTLTEYWEAQPGQNAESDIRSRFPAELAEQVLDGTSYVDELEKQCRKQVLNKLYTSGNLPDRIETLLHNIMSSPAHSSAPGDYIRDHPESYAELMSYGEYALRYCFGQFMNGGQTDLRGHIMAIACEDIMASWGETYRIEPENRMTGQDWFASFRSLAVELDRKFPDAQLHTEYPGAWLLTQMFS